MIQLFLYINLSAILLILILYAIINDKISKKGKKILLFIFFFIHIILNSFTILEIKEVITKNIVQNQTLIMNETANIIKGE